MTPIGYQDGIAGFVGWLRKQAGVQKRGPGYDPADLSTWPWPDKLERTLRILKDEHDAAVPVDPPDDPPPPPAVKLAPQTYNKGSSGQDARYCTKESGNPDAGGFHYDDGGRSLGGRTGNPVAGLKPADQMDGREPCDPYTHDGRSFPPWPKESYDR
jgi:hypothetical protein